MSAFTKVLSYVEVGENSLKMHSGSFFRIHDLLYSAFNQQTNDK